MNEQWRAEFEEEEFINKYKFPLNVNTYGTYSDAIVARMFTMYLAGRKAGVEEVEKWNATLELKDKFLQWTRSKHVECRMLIEDQEKEITNLTAQLKTERECVDFYAGDDSWELRHSLRDEVVCQGDGGKRARETQSKRSE